MCVTEEEGKAPGNERPRVSQGEGDATMLLLPKLRPVIRNALGLDGTVFKGRGDDYFGFYESVLLLVGQIAC
ncbi:hypothetical protein E2C01_033789 [Portunus trituberculatus]|uniref:Uncharacterized protein n=1 Tax=Portunus trituberculatus TaxID=210409 RepID=A0A5B7F545_PORTR|nr:hypothetical protein [Portunus trituberculatus]